MPHFKLQTPIGMLGDDTIYKTISSHKSELAARKAGDEYARKQNLRYQGRFDLEVLNEKTGQRRRYSPTGL